MSGTIDNPFTPRDSNYRVSMAEVLRDAAEAIERGKVMHPDWYDIEGDLFIDSDGDGTGPTTAVGACAYGYAIEGGVYNIEEGKIITPCPDGTHIYDSIANLNDEHHMKPLQIAAYLRNVAAAAVAAVAR